MPKKILIAEDEKPLAKALQMKLSKEGYEVDIANDGEVAVEKLSASKYDLVLLDLMMPKKDGFGVLEDVKKKKIKTKIIVASNLAQESDVAKAKDLGAIDFLVKADTGIAKIVEMVKDAV